jgi:hypothetical protein
MDEPLQAHTPNELEYYLRVTPCARCGHGPLVPQRPEPADAGAAEDGDPAPPLRQASVRTRCKRCGHHQTFHFGWQYDVPDGPGDADCINPSDQPSRIIDLGQWLGLYYMFAEAAAPADSPAEARRAYRQAAMCLAEALKFHGPEELPPEAAFFREASLTAYRANPANYARTRLRELEAVLPAPARAESGTPPDHPAGRPWWKFWQKAT